MQDFNVPSQNHILTKYPLSVFFHTDIHVLSLYCIDIYSPIRYRQPVHPTLSSVRQSIHLSILIISLFFQNHKISLRVS